ncbi:hypothetical protein DPMN_037329 [Dreissena polymorpha]|uniref:Uncharacterized protein n=1 Tax=Dreissena polymorpha TaxID=45954 RepID=A0A9D4MCH2_DREPO|nr:hypothetical protein DPMN_037329 [Dreissena polymorpha]
MSQVGFINASNSGISCLRLTQFNNSCCQEFPALPVPTGSHAIIDRYLAEQQADLSYPQGGATLNLGLHTFLARGQDYLVNKRPYTHKFKPSERCSPNQTLHLNKNPDSKALSMNIITAHEPAAVIISRFWYIQCTGPLVCTDLAEQTSDAL